MKKKIMLSLLVLNLSRASIANDLGAGTVFYTSDGKTEHVKSYVENDDKVTFTRCTGTTKTEDQKNVEFLSQKEVCAIITLDDYEKLLDKVAATLAQSKSQKIEISVTIPPEQRFEEAVALTNKKLGSGAIISKGSDLKIQVFADFIPKGLDYTNKYQAIGPNFWTDKSGYVKIFPAKKESNK